jgi:hypothetical protein
MPLVGRPQRFRFRSWIKIHWGSATLEASVSGISANGMFIETASPLSVGATFSADLMIDPPLQMHCTVTRVDPSRGMAVRIAFAKREQENQFTKLVEKVSASQVVKKVLI